MTTTVNASQPATGTAAKADQKSTSIETTPARLFWGMACVNLIVDAVLAVLLLGAGLATGYEGKPAISFSAVGKAIEYLFGNLGQLALFAVALIVIGVLLVLIKKSHKDDRNTTAIVLGLVVFLMGGLTFTQLHVGANIIPLLVFLTLVVIHSWIGYIVVTHKRANKPNN